MKNNNRLITIFSSTNALKIMSFLSDNPGKDFLGSEIQKATGLSRAGVYIALRDLTKLGLAHRNRKGKILLYSIVYDNPVVKQFKILRSVVALTRTVEKLKTVSRKIVLFGSASRGEDYPDSDLDLFIVAKDPEMVKSIIASAKPGKKIQAIIRTADELAAFNESEKVFSGEIALGTTLWEEHQ